MTIENNSKKNNPDANDRDTIILSNFFEALGNHLRQQESNQDESEDIDLSGLSFRENND